MGNMNGGIDIDCLVLKESLAFCCIGTFVRALGRRHDQRLHISIPQFVDRVRTWGHAVMHEFLLLTRCCLQNLLRIASHRDSQSYTPFFHHCYIAP